MMDPLWSETCWSTFKYFIIWIVSTYYILCISWIIKCVHTKDKFYVNNKLLTIFLFVCTKVALYEHGLEIKGARLGREADVIASLFCVRRGTRQFRTRSASNRTLVLLRFAWGRATYIDTTPRVIKFIIYKFIAIYHNIMHFKCI